MTAGTGRGLLGVTQLFGGLGLSAKPIDASDTDTGVGVDGTEVIFEGRSDTDLGIGSESEPTGFISATVPDEDLGVVIDIHDDIQATLSDTTESGTGVDTGAFSVNAPDAETGVGTETQSITMNISDTDSATGEDTPKLDFDRALIVVVTSISTDIIIEIDWS